MSEFVRDALPSHEATQATAEIESPLVEESSGFFKRLRESASFSRLVSSLGALSLVVPAEISHIQTPEHPSSVGMAGPKEFIILEDQVKQDDPAKAYTEMERIAATGATGVEFTAPWVTGQIAPSDKDLKRFQNATEAANQLGLEVIVKAYPCPHIEADCKNNNPPLTPRERGKFTNWLVNLEYGLPTVKKYIVGNEPNDWAFWWPQRYPNGSPAAAENYFKLEVSSYDALKKNAPKIGDGSDVIVYGLALNAGGTTPVKKFLKNFRKAYLASIKDGRRKPIMDGVAHHPYPADSRLMPKYRYTNGRMGMAEYPQLEKDLEETFAGTPQAKVNWVISYDEYGIETKIPKAENSLYRGKEPASTGAVPETRHAKNLQEALGMAACQRRVVSFTNFLNKDEKNKARWQSGLYYVNGKPKSSLAKLQPSIEDFQAGDDQC